MLPKSFRRVMAATIADDSQPSRRMSAMSARIMRRGASVGIAAALVAGALVMTAPTAEATQCGLSVSGPVFGRYDYTIRNCHPYTVQRKLDIRRPVVGHPDGPCHTIPANSSRSSWTSIPDSAYIDGMKPC